MSYRVLAPYRLIALLLGIEGCAVGTRFAAGHEDYRLYRETRLAATVEDRLSASNRYLQTLPNGQWRDEVRAWFKLGESAYFRAAKNSLPRLRAYLVAMPDGPHAREVGSRIVELESEIAFAERREQRTLSSARRVQTTLSKAAQQRQLLVRDVSEWLRLLAGIDSWGQPTSALDDQLIFRFRLEPPHGSCSGDVCKKSVSIEYAIPEQGAQAERVALFDIELTLAEGGVVRARLAGPELFSRLGEALELNAVAEAKPQTRVEAIGRVLPILENAFETRLPAARCTREVVSPVIFERACDGRRVVASAGLSGDDEDAIVIEPFAAERSQP